MARQLKKPNGYGSVYPLKGRRRNKFIVVITIGRDEHGKQLRNIIGYAKSREEGYQMLAEYHNNPYDLDFKNVTFDDIFKIIEPKMKEQMEKNEKGMSKSNYKNLCNAYYNHLIPIQKWKILDTKKKDLKDFFDNSDACYTTKGYMKNALSRIYSYCIDEIELPLQRNYAKELKIGNKPISEKFNPLELIDVKKIWENRARFYCKILLVFLFTGMRPKELCELETEKTFLYESYSIGGCKTDAGRDRMIPHHNKVKWIFKEFYNPNNKYLFNNPNTGKKFTEKNLSDNIVKELKYLGIYNHYLYDTRGTFATRCDECYISETNVKVFLGHSLGGDVTNQHYIKKRIEYLLIEINKLDYKLD